MHWLVWVAQRGRRTSFREPPDISPLSYHPFRIHVFLPALSRSREQGVSFYPIQAKSCASWECAVYSRLDPRHDTTLSVYNWNMPRVRQGATD